LDIFDLSNAAPAVSFNQGSTSSPFNDSTYGSQGSSPPQPLVDRTGLHMYDEQCLAPQSLAPPGSSGSSSPKSAPLGSEPQDGLGSSQILAAPSRWCSLTCRHCYMTFSRPSDRKYGTHVSCQIPLLTRFSKHETTHTTPVPCIYPGCLKHVATKRELQRHMNAKHPDYSDPPRWYCPHFECPYSREGSKSGFSRPDTCNRHLKNLHPES